jgi:hypothetical protein
MWSILRKTTNYLDHIENVCASTARLEDSMERGEEGCEHLYMVFDGVPHTLRLDIDMFDGKLVTLSV